MVNTRRVVKDQKIPHTLKLFIEVKVCLKNLLFAGSDLTLSFAPRSNSRSMTMAAAAAAASLHEMN